MDPCWIWRELLNQATVSAADATVKVVAPPPSPSDVCPRCNGTGVQRDFTQVDPATGRYGYPELCRARDGGCGGTGKVG